jgi:hypothetical protein
MEQFILELIMGFDLHTIISVGILFWIMTKGIRNDIKSIKSDVQDLDRRLCRIEGAISSKDCCMLKDDKSNKNVG